MNANVGGIDRLLRIVVGLGLIAFALLSQHEYAMWGWVGVVPLATALFRRCPVYPHLASQPANRIKLSAPSQMQAVRRFPEASKRSL
jgi:hypothetical protein